MTNRLRGFALVSLVASILGASSLRIDARQSTASRCDRECLGGLITRYLGAMVAHTPNAVPLAPKVRFTEDTVDMKIGDGLWKAASTIRPYRLDILDTNAGSCRVAGGRGRSRRPCHARTAPQGG
jgi:hypothetical protein